MPIFGDLVPRCCLMKEVTAWKLYGYWGHFHGDGDNTCIHCGMPAYKRWERKYNGEVGFCTRCDVMWYES